MRTYLPPDRIGNPTLTSISSDKKRLVKSIDWKRVHQPNLTASSELNDIENKKLRHSLNHDRKLAP
jgi:hypothetical protein